MSATYRTIVTLAIVLGLCPGGRPAAAVDEDNIRCVEEAAKATRKFAAAILKHQYRCRERPSNPFTAMCNASLLPMMEKEVKKRDKAIARDCTHLDPDRALQYTGCPVPGCQGIDQSATAAGYQACMACASEVLVARLYRVTGNGCGNGFVDAGEECDGASDPRCTAQCTISSVCGNGVLEPREECDDSVAGNVCTQDDYQCVPQGLAKECTCVAPCALDPVPARVAFRTTSASGDHCGCTLADPNDVTCTGTSKVADLECGTLLVGGGLSAAPPGRMPDGSTLYVQLPVCSGNELIIGPDAGEGADPRKSCSKGVDDAGTPQCFLGPPIGVVNHTVSLSTCVINALTRDLRGTMNAAT
jgi:hypothetical protein